ELGTAQTGDELMANAIGTNILDGFATAHLGGVSGSAYTVAMSNGTGGTVIGRGGGRFSGASVVEGLMAGGSALGGTGTYSASFTLEAGGTAIGGGGGAAWTLDATGAPGIAGVTQPGTATGANPTTQPVFGGDIIGGGASQP